ncbi:hypothetical protein Tco_0993361 [Tanacetum coccineum]|uniref:Reverse transcriptase domain-containing protein n=1 Tax=Tanacetum coccineum TaxID=301880 RepID=A0ABQ5F502_9ASTR
MADNRTMAQMLQAPIVAPTPQIQGVSKTDFENYVKANDAVLKNVQNQGQNLQNQMANVMSLLTNLCNNFKDSASTSNSGTLPSQTVTNPRQQINAITTRSGKTLEGPSTPLVPTPVVSIPKKEPRTKPENVNGKVAKSKWKNTAHVDLQRKKNHFHGNSKTKSKENHDPFSGSTTTHSDDPSPSSSPVKTSDNLEEFADELTLLKKDIQEGNFQDHSNPLFEFDDNFKSSTINPLFDEMEEDVKIKNSNVSDEPVLLNTPLSDKVECFAPEDDNDEIDAFLAMEVSSNFEEGYFDSEGDVTFLDNLLSDDASHNLASEVISDHEPEQNESSITFSPRVILSP